MIEIEYTERAGIEYYGTTHDDREQLDGIIDQLFAQMMQWA